MKVMLIDAGCYNFSTIGESIYLLIGFFNRFMEFL